MNRRRAWVALPMMARSVVGGLLLLAGCAAPQPEPEIKAAQGNADIVPIRANAKDDVGVTSMTIYVDGVALSSCGPCTTISYNWNVKRVPPGPHTIVVEARDAAGNVGTSQVTVTRR